MKCFLRLLRAFESQQYNRYRGGARFVITTGSYSFFFLFYYLFLARNPSRVSLTTVLITWYSRLLSGTVFVSVATSILKRRGGRRKVGAALAKEVEENLWENEALDSGESIFEFIFGFHSQRN